MLLVPTKPLESFVVECRYDSFFVRNRCVASSKETLRVCPVATEKQLRARVRFRTFFRYSKNDLRFEVRAISSIDDTGLIGSYETRSPIVISIPLIANRESSAGPIERNVVGRYRETWKRRGVLQAGKNERDRAVVRSSRRFCNKGTRACIHPRVGSWRNGSKRIMVADSRRENPDKGWLADIIDDGGSSQSKRRWFRVRGPLSEGIGP